MSAGEKSYLRRNPREDLIIMLIFWLVDPRTVICLLYSMSLTLAFFTCVTHVTPTKFYVGLSVRTINPVRFSANIPSLSLLATIIDINKCGQSSSHLLLWLVIPLCNSNRGNFLNFVIANFNSVGEDFGFWQVDSPCFTLWRWFKTSSPGFLMHVKWLRCEVTQCW